MKDKWWSTLVYLLITQLLCWLPGIYVGFHSNFESGWLFMAGFLAVILAFPIMLGTAMLAIKLESIYYTEKRN